MIIGERFHEDTCIAAVDINKRSECYIVFPNDNKIHKCKLDKLIDFLKNRNVKVLLCEGNPYLYELSKHFIVYILPSGQKQFRKKYNLRKNHGNDAKLLLKVYREDPFKYIHYIQRQLPPDPLVKDYVILCKEKRRYGNKIKSTTNQEIRKFYSKIRGKINNMRKTLGRKIERKYQEILSKIGIKGIGPYYIYFLMKIPKLETFKSLNQFLKYLGLKGKKKNFNRKARMILGLATINVKYEDLDLKPPEKENKKEIDWRKARKIAKITYYKLRNNSENNANSEGG